MTKFSKTILALISGSIMIFSCKNPLKTHDYKGYQNVIDTNNIKSVNGKLDQSIINVDIPTESSVSFNYNKSLTDVSFVKLQKTLESTITAIDKILFTKDRIIVVDIDLARTVYIFDSAGRFINSIVSARDAAAKKAMISNFLDVAYDYNSDEIILHDQDKKKTYYFDKDGNFKNSTKEYIYFLSITNLQHTDLFVYLNPFGGNNHIPALDKSTVYIGKKDTRIAYTATAAIKQMRPNVNYIINHNPSIINSNENLFYTPDFCDTVYEIVGKPLSISPKLVFHYPGPDINSALKAAHKVNPIFFRKLANTDQYYSFQGEVLGSVKGIYYFTSYKHTMDGYFFSEKTHRIIGGDLSFKGPPTDTIQTDTYRYPFTMFNDHFVSILRSSDFKKNGLYTSKQLAEIRKNVKPDDNPVLLIYKLKDF